MDSHCPAPLGFGHYGWLRKQIQDLLSAMRKTFPDSPKSLFPPLGLDTWYRNKIPSGLCLLWHRPWVPRETPIFLTNSRGLMERCFASRTRHSSRSHTIVHFHQRSRCRVSFLVMNWHFRGKAVQSQYGTTLVTKPQIPLSQVIRFEKEIQGGLGARPPGPQTRCALVARGHLALHHTARRSSAAWPRRASPGGRRPSVPAPGMGRTRWRPRRT